MCSRVVLCGQTDVEQSCVVWTDRCGAELCCVDRQMWSMVVLCGQTDVEHKKNHILTKVYCVLHKFRCWSFMSVIADIRLMKF
jgi:hypothetical protein